MIRFENVGLRYGMGPEVLRDLNFQVTPKSFQFLTGPSGAVWEWNRADDSNRITGSAVEFCQVVTQGRNILDTKLEVVGNAASQWMSIAQCFAGAPSDPPRPGERVW